MPDHGFLEELASIVGPAYCIAAPDESSPYLSDFRHLFTGSAVAVVKPASTQQVADAVRACNRYGYAVVPFGGNTGLCGGAVPSANGNEVVISLERMNKVRAVDLTNNMITVDAGCILQRVQEEAAKVERCFPLSLNAEGSCQIGGNIATNAGGTAVLRYGNTRELVLGLEVVLPSGEIFSDLRGLRKNNTGYDLKQLFIGSEGTLGIVTGAALKLFPARRQVETVFVAVNNLDNMLALYLDARERAGEFLSAFELIPRIGLEKAMRYVPGIVDPLAESHGFYALIELSSSQTLLALGDVLSDFVEANLTANRICDGAIAASMRESRMFWQLREACVEAQRLAGPSFKHDVSVPLNAIPRFIEDTTEGLLKHFPDVEVVAFGHVGDGNIHYNVCIGQNQTADVFLEHGPQIEAMVYEAVAVCGGSFSAEHGIGLLKRDALVRYASPCALGLMASLKRVLDPDNMLNPGKVLKLPKSETGTRAAGTFNASAATNSAAQTGKN